MPQPETDFDKFFFFFQIFELKQPDFRKKIVFLTDMSAKYVSFSWTAPLRVNYERFSYVAD